MTLEQIILIYKDIATRHMQINGFVASEDYDLGVIDDRDFPLLAIVPTSASLPNTENGYSSFDMDFEIKVLDLVDSDLHNQMHVYSDAIEILKDVVNEINTHPYYTDNGVVIRNDIEFSKLDEFTDGELYGYGTSLTLTTPNKISFCGSPLSEITGYPNGGIAGENDVTIVNTTGSFSIIGIGGTTVTLDDVTHVDSDGSNVVTPAQEPFTATPFTDVVVTDDNNVSSPISLGSGDTYTCEPPFVNDWFELEVDTTIAAQTNNDQFKISVISSFTLEVDIMDGNGSTFIKGTSNSDPQLIFTFPTAGVNIIRIKGYLPFKFNTLGDSAKITDIRNWGCGNVWAGGNQVLRCVNMVNEISAKDTIGSSTGDLRFAFTGSSWSGNNAYNAQPYNLQSSFSSSQLNANLGHWDLRNITTLTGFAASVTTWSQENYSNTILGWLRWDSLTHAPSNGYILPSNIAFHAGTTVGNTSTVAIGSEAELARDYLINTLNWTITDGGAV